MKDSNTFYLELLKKIKVVRLMKNISAKEMAFTLKISYRTYLYIEEGKTNLSLKRMIEICNFLNISLENLIRLNYEINENQ